MARKSKQAGGNLPLTHYERTKKFASSEYGTTTKRLAGHSQYQLGDCALSLTKLGDAALCSPSGYLYSDSAILEYLLTKTQDLKDQRAQYERRLRDAEMKEVEHSEREKRKAFEESQQLFKRQKVHDSAAAAKEELKRTSYWIAAAQPKNDVEDHAIKPPPERPLSPHTEQPLRRKDLWPVKLIREGDKILCSLSGKVIHSQAAKVYWTDKKQPGSLVLTSVYDDLITDALCPTTNQKIRQTRDLQRSGTSFAASGQLVEAKLYRPTIT